MKWHVSPRRVIVFPAWKSRRDYSANILTTSMTSHLIGYIGRINDSDIQQLEDDETAGNYRGSDYIGKTGLEQSYENELHGTTGVEQMEVDAGGRGVRVLSRTPPVSGNTSGVVA